MAAGLAAGLADFADLTGAAALAGAEALVERWEAGLREGLAARVDALLAPAPAWREVPDAARAEVLLDLDSV